MMNKELFEYQGNLYWVYRKVKEDHIKSENISDLKEFWGCDVVLKESNNTNGYLIFLILIPEAEILEFFPNKT